MKNPLLNSPPAESVSSARRISDVQPAPSSWSLPIGPWTFPRSRPYLQKIRTGKSLSSLHFPAQVLDFTFFTSRFSRQHRSHCPAVYLQFAKFVGQLLTAPIGQICETSGLSLKTGTLT